MGEVSGARVNSGVQFFKAGRTLMRVVMPLCGRATARNCSALLGCPRSHMGSCSLEGPRWSRDRLPLGADGFLCAALRLHATSARGDVSCRAGSGQVQVRCAGTTHVWRGSRHGDGEGSVTVPRPLRPRPVSGPSDRPRPRGRGTSPGPPCGLGAGAGPPPARQEPRARRGSQRIGLGLAPLARRHGERGAQDPGQALLGAEGGAPVPREEPCPSHDARLTRGPPDLAQGGWRGRDLARPHEVPRLVQEAHLQALGVPVEATIHLVRRDGASPGGSSS
jgi:hypothetical protein